MIIQIMRIAIIIVIFNTHVVANEDIHEDNGYSY